MKFTGTLLKMRTELAQQVQYYLIFEDEFIHVNQLLNKKIKFTHIGNDCLSCHLDRKIFRQGFCYNCFNSQPIAGEWVIRPELSTAHLDQEDRDLNYEKKVQLQPHIVYLANSSNIKVGVTRKSQVPTRWIDQGAHEAIEIAETPNRYLAGITEIALKEHVSDKTNYRKMLTNNLVDVDLISFRESLKKYIPEETQDYYIPDAEPLHIHYPVLKYPEKAKPVNLAKQPIIEGVLVGIKGQYLIFEDGRAMNVRSQEGLVVDLEIDSY